MLPDFGRYAPKRIKRRAEGCDLPPDHVARQRHLALFLVVTGFIRVVAWTTLGVLYLVGVPFTGALFSSVAFVALISLYANAATDFGQACASLAQLAAADAHSAAKVGAQEDLQQKGPHG